MDDRPLELGELPSVVGYAFSSLLAGFRKGILNLFKLETRFDWPA
jgi:hypothetical protein